jgi:hypothetical protein
VRQNPFLADRFWPCVMHLDGTDHGRPRHRLRSLCPNDYGASQRTDGGDPDCKRRGAHPSRKMSHRLRSAAPRNEPTQDRRAISGRRWGSSRRDFTESGYLSKRWLELSLQKFIPIISPARFVAGVANERFNFGGI